MPIGSVHSRLCLQGASILVTDNTVHTFLADTQPFPVDQ
jgi:hypothetical protein